MTHAPDGTILSAAGIQKRFGALVVLDDIDFAMGADEAVGIVGPNGAGKTTLLSCMAGVLGPRERVRHGCRCGRVTRRPHQGRA